MNPTENGIFPANKSTHDLCQLRQNLLSEIYLKPESTPEDPALTQIAKTLGQFAGNEPTAYESGIVQTSATGSANLLTRQVERAITQVLGRGPS
jgi:hypothetical protein